MKLSAYLDRIGFSGELRQDAETLKAIHRAHITTVPYEDLDVQFGRPLTIDPAAAYEKIVERRRGGWCYEMNGVLGWALAAAGFKVTRLCSTGQGPGSHLVIQVDLDEPWICDVGTGEGVHEPYPLREGPFEQRGFGFRVDFHDGYWRMNNHQHALVPGFDVHPTNEALLAERCAHLQSSPESPFVQNAIAFRQDADGYSSLLGRIFRRVQSHGVVEKFLVADERHYLEVLETRFGLDLPEAASLWPRICARHEDILAAKAKAAAQAPT